MNITAIIAVGLAVQCAAITVLVMLVWISDVTGYQRGRAECASIITNGGTK